MRFAEPQWSPKGRIHDLLSECLRAEGQAPWIAAQKRKAPSSQLWLIALPSLWLLGAVVNTFLGICSMKIRRLLGQARLV